MLRDILSNCQRYELYTSIQDVAVTNVLLHVIALVDGMRFLGALPRFTCHLGVTVLR